MWVLLSTTSVIFFKTSWGVAGEKIKHTRENHFKRRISTPVIIIGLIFFFYLANKRSTQPTNRSFGLICGRKKKEVKKITKKERKKEESKDGSGIHPTFIHCSFPGLFPARSIIIT